jgi:predicted phosphate transport protein (TIGR00153 family)
MARFQLLPAETRFYDLFEKGGANLLRSAELLHDLIENFQQPQTKASRITEAERDGDIIVHQIDELLHKTLITPLDPQDTQQLCQALDDVVDTIEQVANVMLLYKVEQPTPQARQLSAVIVASAGQINAALPLLRDQKKFSEIQKHIVEVHRLENEADMVGRLALEQLVASSRHDWFEFMRWKEIYDLLEQATDLCEDIADVLHTVVLKNG